ncbi:MAG TPA: hypothetical protein VM056_04450, partial [Terriglobales bacterium]|nr:hypothetical protein [Terriglobales bacterium]
FIYTYRIAPRLRSPEAACGIDLNDACSTADRFSRWVLWFSAAIYAVGFFVAFLLGPILLTLDNS